MASQTKLLMAIRNFYITMFVCFFSISATSQTLSVGIIDIPPWGEFQKKKIEGLQIDLYKALSKELKGKLKLSYELIPLKRAIHYLKTGQKDIISIYERDILEDYVDYIANIHVFKYVLVVSNEFEDGYDIEKLNTIGIINGEFDLIEHRLKHQFKLGKNIYSGAVTYEQLVRMLTNKRIDAICITANSLRLYKNRLDLSDEDIDKLPVIAQVKEKMYFSKRSVNYSEQNKLLMQKAMTSLRHSGKLQEIKQKYDM